MSIKERMSELWQKINAVKEKASAEKRDMSEEEQTEVRGYLDQIDELKGKLELENRMAATESDLRAIPESDNAPQGLQVPDGAEVRVGDNREAKKPWRSFGEFLKAVYSAAIPGRSMDQRLIETRAGTGLEEGTPSLGGFLVQKDFAAELLKKMHNTGLLAGRCRNVPISGTANGMKINYIDETSRANGSRLGGIRGYWLDEAGTKTASKPAFGQIELNLHKLIGLCYATDELLQDTAALESIISDGFAEEFGFKVDDAIVNGTGVGQPLGIMNSNCIVSVTKETGQSADTIVLENIVKAYARFWPRSRANGVWIANVDTIPQLMQLSLAVGTGGAPAYLPANGLAGRPYDTLMGMPILFIEHAATLGDTGDLILCDFSQYITATKGGVDAASSIHVQFVTDQTVFRFVYRIDGQPIWNEALTPYKGSNSVSPFVKLAAR